MMSKPIRTRYNYRVNNLLKFKSKLENLFKLRKIKRFNSNKETVGSLFSQYKKNVQGILIISASH